MHLTKEQKARFKEDSLDQSQWIEVLEHLRDCDFCREELDKDETKYKAPAYLKEEIICRAQKMDVQAESIVNTASKKMQLFFYGLKTAAAVLATVVMIFAMPSMENREDTVAYGAKEVSNQITRQINDRSNEVTQFLNKFSYKIIQGNGGNKE